jgi:hypothetical protein
MSRRIARSLSNDARPIRKVQVVLERFENAKNAAPGRFGSR